MAQACDVEKSRGQSEAPARETSARAWAILLFVLPLLAYLPVLRAGFIWDDDSYVENNPSLRSLEGLRRIWTDWAATPQYYPLVHSSFWIEYHLWGASSALGYHLVNVLLHACGAVLLWRLLRQLAVPGAWLAAAIFAVHPVNVESVAWVTERKNVLCGVFYLLAFSAYLRAVELPDRVDRRAYVRAFVFFLLALFSKTVSSTLPAAVLLVLWWKRGTLRWKEVWPLVPFFVAGLLLAAVTGHLERTKVGAHGPEWDSLTVAHRVLIAGRAVSFYAGKMVWPARLVFAYPRWHVDPRAGWQWIFPASVMVVLLALFFLRRKIGRGPITAALFFVGTLVPALGFVDVYPMRYSFVADHFVYLAGIGPIALMVGIVFSQKVARSGQAGWAAAVLLMLMILTFMRCFAYRDRETIWRDTVTKNPGSWMAHANLGQALKARGAFDEAFAEYRKELEIAPQLPEPHDDVGWQLAARGRLSEAAEQFELSVEMDPGYAPGWAHLAKARLSLNDVRAAETAARRATEVAPNFAEGWNELGKSLQRQGRLVEAMEAFRRAADLGEDGVPSDK